MPSSPKPSPCAKISSRRLQETPETHTTRHTTQRGLEGGQVPRSFSRHRELSSSDERSDEAFARPASRRDMFVTEARLTRACAKRSVEFSWWKDAYFYCAFCVHVDSFEISSISPWPFSQSHRADAGLAWIRSFGVIEWYKVVGRETISTPASTAPHNAKRHKSRILSRFRARTAEQARHLTSKIFAFL